MCPGGGLSLVAVEILEKAGFKDVKSLKGGTDLWHQSGYPTTIPKSDEGSRLPYAHHEIYAGDKENAYQSRA
jgi:3-mercaptopyruvate sulfurtransferase SseA